MSVVTPIRSLYKQESGARKGRIARESLGGGGGEGDIYFFVVEKMSLGSGHTSFVVNDHVDDRAM